MTYFEDYDRILGRDPAAAAAQAEQLRAGLRRAGVMFGDEPMASFVRPHLVDRAGWSALVGQGRRLLELAARVARRAFHGDVERLCGYLGLPEAHVRWIRIDPGEPDVVLSRLDAFLTDAGPRFIEVNSDAPAGFGYGDRMAPVFQELPAFVEFSARYPVSYQASAGALVAAVKRLYGGRDDGDPLVAIVDFDEVRTRADQQILREAFEASGVRCRLADPRRLTLAGGRLCVGSDPIDVVYRRGVLAELVGRQDELRDFFTAYERGLAVFVNSFRCQLSEDKVFFALLADEEFSHLLSGAEQEFVARVVPWTRRLEERRTLREGHELDLVPYVLAHREELVLKPAHGYGGSSVYVGSETRPAEWDAAVQRALGTASVVQERVTIPEEPFPVFDGGRLGFERLKVNVNPFYVRGAEVGAITRVSRSAVINVSAGGGSVPTFVVG